MGLTFPFTQICPHESFFHKTQIQDVSVMNQQIGISVVIESFLWPLNESLLQLKKNAWKMRPDEVDPEQPHVLKGTHWFLS